MKLFDILLHRWLRIPYTLHVRFNQRPKKPQATVIFIHGIGNSGDAWSSVIAKIPNTVAVVTVDLLGFGESSKPTWATYSAKTQANSVIATLMKLRMRGPVVIVGHSLGALVAIEVARRYPKTVQQLVLCAPPLYRPDSNSRLPRHSDAVLRRLYAQVDQYPDMFIKIAAFATKYSLVNKTFSVTPDNVHSYIATLRTAILNQTSLEDAKKLKVKTTILYGSLDPLVVTRNIRTLAKNNNNVSSRMIVAGHEIKGRMVPAVIRSIKQVLDTPDKV